MVTVDFTNMNGAALVEWFNTNLNATLQERVIKGFKPVKAFGSRERALARCGALLAVINGEPLPPPLSRKRNPKKEKTAPPLSTGLLYEIVGPRVDTYKGRCMQILIENEGRQLTHKELSKKLYGKITGAVDNVVNNVALTVKRKKQLGYEIRRELNAEKEKTVGLHSTKK